jgi:hypothetical protein
VIAKKIFLQNFFYLLIFWVFDFYFPFGLCTKISSVQVEGRVLNKYPKKIGEKVKNKFCVPTK